MTDQYYSNSSNKIVGLIVVLTVANILGILALSAVLPGSITVSRTTCCPVIISCSLPAASSSSSLVVV